MLNSLFNIFAEVCIFIGKRLQQRCFSVKISKFLATLILQNICKKVLLNAGLSQLLESYAFFSFFYLWLDQHVMCCCFYFHNNHHNINGEQAFKRESKYFYADLIAAFKWCFEKGFLKFERFKYYIYTE